MEHVGIVMSRERIAAEALGYSFGGDTNNIDVQLLIYAQRLMTATT